jgi:hypothetical protein
LKYELIFTFCEIRVHMIANFEGQLTVGPDNLEVDDSEYGEIPRSSR